MYYCFASAETDYETIIEVGIPCVLFSYYGMRSWKPEKFIEISRRIRERTEGSFIMIDSGAFTLASIAVRKDKRLKDINYAFARGWEIFGHEIESYITEYIDFLLAIEGNYDVFVEVDVGRTEIKRENRERFLSEGLIPIPVKHITDPIDYWDELCTTFPIVGVGNLARSDTGMATRIISQAVSYGKRHGAKLHGLGMTKLWPLQRFGHLLYSVDSTYWLSGRKFGNVFEFHPGMGLKSSDDKTRKRALKKKAKALGINYDDWLADKGSANHLWTAHQFNQYAGWLNDELEKRRPFYWEDGYSRRQEPEMEWEGEQEEGESSAPFGGGHNVPGSTQPGEIRSPEERLVISEAMRGNLSNWKHGQKSNRLPSLHCDNCQVSETCVHHREGSICTVPDEFRQLADQLDNPTPENVLQVLVDKAQRDFERWERAVAAESAYGGVLDKSVTDLSARLEKTLKLIAVLQGRMDIVGGRRVINVTQQNLIIGGEISQTALILLKLPPERRGELLSTWQENIATQRQILEEAGVDVAGVSGLGGVASTGHVLAELEERMSSPPGVEGRPPGKVEGRGIKTIDGEARVVG